MGKLLFVGQKNQGGIQGGGEVLTEQHFNLLSEFLGEENVKSYSIKENKLRGYYRYISWFIGLSQHYFFGLSTKKMKEILLLSGEYEYIFIDRSVYGILAKYLKEKGCKSRIICFFHNIESVYFKAKISTFSPWRWLVIYNAYLNDKYACKYADKVFVLNERDDVELYSKYARRADVLLPIILKDRYRLEHYTQEMTGHKPKCLFIGSYFRANTEGIKWFIKYVFPFVSIKLTIIGREMYRLKREIEITNNIEILSDVDNLVPFYEEADIMVFPIFSGSGMKVKTCESMMYGKNILATEEAFEGYEIDHNSIGGVCNTAHEFISCITNFSQYPRPRFNQYARQRYLDKYSQESAIQKMNKILQ